MKQPSPQNQIQQSPSYRLHQQRVHQALDMMHDELADDLHPQNIQRNLKQMIENSLHVLLVEDNHVHARFLRSSLDRCHMVEISEAINVQQAISYLIQAMSSENHQPDLLLLDMDLPDGSGLDIIQMARNTVTYKYTPIVVLSNTDDTHCIQACLDAGANAFMTKMLQPQQLDFAIAHTVGFWRHVQRAQM